MIFEVNVGFEGCSNSGSVDERDESDGQHFSSVVVVIPSELESEGEEVVSGELH
jgi:hypothetical protein